MSLLRALALHMGEFRKINIRAFGKSGLRFELNLKSPVKYVGGLNSDTCEY